MILLRTDAASGKPSLTRDSNVMLIPTGIVESAEHPVCLARDAAVDADSVLLSLLVHIDSL